MDREKISKQRKEIFERINKELAGEYIAAVYQDKEVSGMEDGILNVYLDDVGGNFEDVIGQYFFTPITTDDDQIQIFNAVVFLTEDISEKKLPALYEAMSYINYYSLVGAFSIDEMHSQLAYKISIPMPIEMSDDALYDQVQAIMGNGMITVDKFADLLLGINNGTRNIKEFIEIIKNISSNNE